MKKIFTLLLAVSLAAGVFLPRQASAQTPGKMSYQAVIRNGSDILVANAQIGMEINIRKGSISGPVVYTETQTPTTNANGLVSIEIGGGVGFDTINWSSGPYFLETKTDPTGGTNYTITGTSQLLSVPYALHAQTAETLSGGVTETDPLFTAWDKSTGISITESQISDMGNYIETETDPAVTTNFDFTGAVTGDLLQFNGTKWVKVTPNYLTSYTETDPLWTATSSDYYTKTQMQTGGQSQLHWDNVTNKPTTLAGYGAELDPTWGGTNDETGNIFRTGKVSIGSSDTAALLYTYGGGTGGGNVLFVGSYKSTPGNPPATGQGTRMMWYPDKAAFRAGYVHNTNWDKDNIGLFSFAAGANSKANGDYSTAMGYNTTASGQNSTAMGFSTTASAYNSTAMGGYTTASGNYSTAMGGFTKASGNYSTAMGWYTNAFGDGSTAMGSFTTASSMLELVIGTYNTIDTLHSATSWDASDRLFVIGNGISTSARSDAMVVLKNGNVGLGTSTPERTLHVNSVMRLQPTSTAPASPAEGDMYMNATTHKLMVYDGTTWQACW